MIDKAGQMHYNKVNVSCRGFQNREITVVLLSSDKTGKIKKEVKEWQISFL